MLFDKYSDFIDVYAEIREDERDSIRQEINEHKENFKEGKQEGVNHALILFLNARFGVKDLELFERNISKIADIGKLKALIEATAQANSVQDVAKLI